MISSDRERAVTDRWDKDRPRTKYADIGGLAAFLLVTAAAVDAGGTLNR